MKAPFVDEELLAETIRRAPAGDLFVFGYGSLMWRPGFAYHSAAPARIYGFHRRCAVYSTHYRGTAAAPGLVFGLDTGGCCVGMLYRISGGAQKKQAVIRYLFEREMFADVYTARYVRAFAAAVNTPPRARGRTQMRGGGISALTFIVRKNGRQYAPPLPPAAAAKIIRTAAGVGGSNREYIENTRHHLQMLGISCPMVTRLCKLL